MSQPDDHPRVRFVGGPSDGLTMAWHLGPPPPTIMLPVQREPTFSETLASINKPLEPQLCPPAAAYARLYDDLGFPRRADDGLLLYGYKGQ